MCFTIKNSNIQGQDEPPNRYQLHNAIRKDETMIIVYPVMIWGKNPTFLAKIKYHFSLHFCSTVLFKLICIPHRMKFKFFHVYL